MKMQLGYGNTLAQQGNQQGQGWGGKADSSWGLGVSPYAVTPAPAKEEGQVENRQGDQSMKDTGTIDYEQLYSGQEYAHGFSSENQLHGQFDLSAPPKKIEEVNSFPESQQALAKYIDIIGAYADGEEQAVQIERIPLEYQELVKQYFSQIKQDAKGKKSDSAKSDSSSASGDKESGDTGSADSGDSGSADSGDSGGEGEGSSSDSSGGEG